MLIFATLQAVTPYIGIGGGFARSKRIINNISFAGKDIARIEIQKNQLIDLPHENNKDSKLNKSISKNGFVAKIFTGFQYSACSKFFTGLEGYGGYQKAENDYFKTGLFFGGQAFVGANLSHGFQGSVGFGIDASKHTSKAIDSINTFDNSYNLLKTPDASYWSLAPCINARISKNLTKNVSLCLDGQFILPKEKETSEFTPETQGTKYHNQLKMKLKSSHQRYLLSLIVKF